jgi:Transcriptional Coactivator p15 (PC4)
VGRIVSGGAPITADGPPVVIAEWNRNSREVVRIDLSRYRDASVIGIRIWYRDGETLRPSKTGITLSTKHLPALADGLASALTRARELGLIDVKDGAP